MDRWVGTYFTEWVEEAQRLEKERMGNPEVLSHPGFGVDQAEAFEAAWVQWFEYVGYLNDGAPEEGDPEVEEHIVVDDDEDED